MENMESLRTNESQGRLRNTCLENGLCHFQCKSPKYKRRRVSAVREFPLRCGRFVKDTTSVGTSVNVPKESLVNGVAFAGTAEHLIGGGRNGDGQGVQKLMTSTGQVEETDLMNGRVLEKTAAAQYPPPRRVKAVRNLPPLCGRNASAKAMDLDHVKVGLVDKPSSSNTANSKRPGLHVQDEGLHQNGLRANVSEVNGGKAQHIVEFKHKRKSPSDISYRHQPKEDSVNSEQEPKRVIVPSLKPAAHHSWLGRKVARKSIPGTIQIKKKKLGSKLQLESANACMPKADSGIGGSSLKNIHPVSGKTSHQGTGQLPIRDKDYSLDQVIPGSYHKDACPPKEGSQAASSSRLQDNHTNVDRKKVTATLRRFRDICKELQVRKSREGKTSLRRVDYLAARILKKEGIYTGEKKLGHVPGVEVNDVFHYRMELNILGLHYPSQAGIDYGSFGGDILATSIVASGGYADELNQLNCLTYTGQGGNLIYPDKCPEDQKLEKGNLALRNSMYAHTPVRVIRGIELSDGGTKTYFYNGLYLVEKYWQEVGTHGKLVFKFKLNRMGGQSLLQKR